MQIWIKNIELENIHIPVQARHLNALENGYDLFDMLERRRIRKVLKVLAYNQGLWWPHPRIYHDDPAKFGDLESYWKLRTFKLKDQQTEFGVFRCFVKAE